jgi:chromosome segregation ATPase
MTQLAAAYDRMEELKRQADAITAQYKVVSQEVEGLEQQLAPLVADYQDRTVKMQNLLAKIEDVAEKKSKIPQWSKWRDWVFMKFNSISADMLKEAQEMLESFKTVTPATTRFVFRRESIEEGIGSRLISWLKAMSRRSWRALRALERALM